MLYRILGALSIALGSLFGLLALLILLPFLDNFNLTLLILAGVFGILAWILLAIGWQLFHPPETTEEAIEERELATREQVAPDADAPPPSEAAVGEPQAPSPDVVPGSSGPTRPGGHEVETEAEPQPEAEPDSEPDSEPEPEPPLRPVPPEQTFVSLGEQDGAGRAELRQAEEEAAEGERAGAEAGEEEDGRRDPRSGRRSGGRFRKPGAPLPDRSDDAGE